MDPILFWNDVAIEVHRRDYAFNIDPATGKEIMPQQGGPTRTSRALAIVHIAMYDAWNGAKATGNNYLGQGGRPPLPAAPPGTPLAPATKADMAAGVAVAGAAMTALKQLFSNQLAYIEEQMLKFCAMLSAGTLTPAQISAYENYGRQVAEVLLMLRDPKTDHSDAPESYVAGGSPGDHRPDPYSPAQGYLGSRWGHVTPFCVNSPVGSRATRRLSRSAARIQHNSIRQRLQRSSRPWRKAAQPTRPRRGDDRALLGLRRRQGFGYATASLQSNRARDRRRQDAHAGYG